MNPDDSIPDSEARALVDIVLPAYNAEATIESAVQSLRSQTFTNLRIIVVDDGSTDGTAAILRRLALEDNRILVISTTNGGIVDALNTGLAACTADLVARFDADDIAFPDRLQKQVAYLALQSDCVAVGGNVFHVDAEGRRTGTVTGFREAVSGDPFYAPALEPYLLHPFLLARRSALLRVAGYRYVFHSEDADLYWRLAGIGRLANVVDILGEYRIHADSVSAKSALNGRIAAVSSQLAALSERRRRNGVDDIVFLRTALAQFQKARTLGAILDLASRTLSGEERAYLEIATVAKLLEFVALRPYRLDRDDLATMRRLIETHYRSMPAANRRQLVFKQVLRTSSARTALENLSLIPWKIMPLASWHLFLFALARVTRRPR